MLSASLDAVGLNRAVLGLGDADLYRQLLTELGVEGEHRDADSGPLAEHNLVGLEMAVDEVDGLDAHGRETLLRLPGLRGGAEVLDQARELGGAAVERAAQRLQQTYDLLVERGVAGSRPARPRACSATSATTPARSSRSTTRRSATSSAAVAATTTSSGASGAPCRPPGSVSTWSGCTSPRWRRSG